MSLVVKWHAFPETMQNAMLSFALCALGNGQLTAWDELCTDPQIPLSLISSLVHTSHMQNQFFRRLAAQVSITEHAIKKIKLPLCATKSYPQANTANLS